jgi:hypothetical protein
VTQIQRSRPVIGSEAALNALNAGRPVFTELVRLASGDIVRRVELPTEHAARTRAQATKPAGASLVYRNTPPRPAPAPPWYARLSGRGWAALAGAAIVLLLGIGWLIYWVIAALIAVAPLLAVAAVAALLLLGGGGACTTVVRITHHH